ncbi:MAG: hypothetical protein KBG15_23030 [Kofleriaceae bacterium]|nr:hypothetical protein [Kofleriaceae bacterium]
MKPRRYRVISSLPRSPDGVPHDIVGATIMGTLIVGFAVALLWSVAGPAVAAAVGAVAALGLILGLSRRAKRERNEAIRRGGRRSI